MAKAVKGAGKPNVKKKNCKWACKSKHKHDIIKDSLNMNGVVTRGTISWWKRPHEHFLKGNMPKGHDKNGNPITALRVTPWWGVRWDRQDRYLIQRHHVIPCKSLSKVRNLSKNLKYLGWDINNEDMNGICLPAYDEQIFWHDLPRHCGYTKQHARYNRLVKNELKEEWESEWKDLCENDEEMDLLDYVQEYVDATRNMIVQWDSSVFLVQNGGDRAGSFKNAGYSRVPSVSKHSNREYPGN